MGESEAELQAITYNQNAFEGRTFIFVVDICSNLQSISGAECEGDAEDQYAVLKNITL